MAVTMIGTRAVRIPKKKKRASGGAVLLKEKGSEYFSKLALKGAEKRKELEKQALLWQKSQMKKKTK